MRKRNKKYVKKKKKKKDEDEDNEGKEILTDANEGGLRLTGKMHKTQMIKIFNVFAIIRISHSISDNLQVTMFY